MSRFEDCVVGQRVKINLPGSVCHDELGTIVDQTASDEALVRLDIMKPEYEHYGDLKTGCITVIPEMVEFI